MSAPEPRSVAIVTGAGRGIGLGIARTLHAAGFRVALTDIDGKGAEQAAAEVAPAGPEAIGATLDVADAAAWEKLVADVTARWGGVDVLVNNAGVSPRGTVLATDDALWESTLATNLKGPWLGIKAALPSLLARKGTIVNIGSTHSVLPMPGLFAYGVSKAGLLGLTRHVAAEYLDELTCNMIAPGWVASPGERAIQAREGRPDFPAGIHHMSSAEDVGAAVLYLVSFAARNVTGVVLYLDGGLHMIGDVGRVHFGK
jgi:NAD(P)-dependent dehydrogenase (short-subunit alcohol dehydrogenase family)